MMKINPFLTLCALLIGGLLFYGFHAADVSLLYSSTAAVVSTIALILLLGIGLDGDSRHSTLLKTVAFLLLLVSLPLNCVFAWFGAAEAVVIITNGVLLLVGAIAVYLLIKVNRVS